MEVSLLVYITTISLILIVICNCSILNPGPNINTNSSSDSCFKIFYQNVQIVHGFIAYGSLGNKYPVLNFTKLLEFQAYVSNNQPDIIIYIIYIIIIIIYIVLNENLVKTHYYRCRNFSK